MINVGDSSDTYPLSADVAREGYDWPCYLPIAVLLLPSTRRLAHCLARGVLYYLTGKPPGANATPTSVCQREVMSVNSANALRAWGATLCLHRGGEILDEFDALRYVFDQLG